MKLLAVLTVVCLAGAFAEEIVYNYLPTDRTANLNSINQNSRVVGGQDAPRGMFPYMVRLYVNMVWGDYYTCGGVLISLSMSSH